MVLTNSYIKRKECVEFHFENYTSKYHYTMKYTMRKIRYYQSQELTQQKDQEFSIRVLDLRI